MTVTDRAKKILDPKELNLPARPPVAAIEVGDYFDVEDNDALRVQVILSEEATDDDITGEAVIDIKSAIRDALRAEGIEEFAYIFFAKRSELESLDNAE